MVQYKYDAWGKPISKTGSMASTLGTVQPFRYRGYVYDEETGLYYLKSRFYAVEHGRFVNADIYLMGRANLWMYCSNNPSVYKDINGTEEELAWYAPVVEYALKTLAGNYYQRFSMLSEAEQTLALNHPFAALKVHEAQESAEHYTNLIFGEAVPFVTGEIRSASNCDGTIANAFKHAYWNALMARDIGPELAEKFANAHESVPVSWGNEPYLLATELEHSQMDFFYNELGRKSADSLSNDDLAYKVYSTIMQHTEKVIIRTVYFDPDFSWYKQR